MKITYLITRMDELGGAQVHVRDLCLWMKEQGNDVALLSGRSGKVSDFLEMRGMRCVEIKNLQRSISLLKDMRAFLEIRKVLKKDRPDILTCHSSKAGIIGRLAARSLGIPVVFTAHGWAFTDGVPKTQKIVYELIERCSSFFGDHIITVSQYDRNLALRKKIVPPDKITAIWNGMPYLPLSQRTIDTESPVVILMVARIGAQKDHAGLLRALKECQSQNWILNFVGGGDAQELQKMSDSMGFGGKVHFMGERSDIVDLMAESDLFALISHWEGLPLTIIEAMRAGLPVVASKVGGVGELVVQNETGFLVPPESDKELSDALDRLLSDRDRLQEMGRAGRALYEREFTFSKMAEKTLDVYKKASSS